LPRFSFVQAKKMLAAVQTDFDPEFLSIQARDSIFAEWEKINYADLQR
jgi:hypothetical protein